MTVNLSETSARAEDPSENARRAILDAALPHVAFEGWTDKTLRMACKDAGLPQGSEALYFPQGPLELIAFWGEVCDDHARDALRRPHISALKIREKITHGVIARLGAIGPHEEAARRALARLALPTSGGTGPKILWQAADTLWRAIGDTSTDVNFYSKRTVLSAVIASTLPVWLSDDSEDKEKAKAFLGRRIENVMQFEKVKAKARARRASIPDPIAALSKMRFGRKKRWRR